MSTITVDVWLYGPLAQYGGEAARRSHANPQITLDAGSTVGNLIEALSMPTEERGITFINGDLSAMPGLQPDLVHVLQDGDRIAFFHLKSMWPCQYRHGAAVLPEMAEAMEEKGKLFSNPSNTE